MKIFNEKRELDVFRNIFYRFDHHIIQLRMYQIAHPIETNFAG